MATTQTTEGWTEIDQSIHIGRPADELYGIWRDVESLPRILTHVKNVRETSPGRSRWIVEGPAGSDISWESVIVDEQPGSRISWRSVPDSEVDNEGSVEFLPGADGVSTEVRVRISYRPPAGALGNAVATLLGKNPEKQVQDDLGNFKKNVEGGTFGTTSV